MINWDFIAELEGSRLRGYVPDPEESQSGVTIASGVDLGQMSEAVFETLSADVRTLVQPYLGLRKQDAVDALAKHELVVTQEQADELNEAVRKPIVSELSRKYTDEAGITFETIPDAAQTVVCSVAFQWGAIWQRCPRFWENVTSQDWTGTIYELEHFGDNYSTRREKEAMYLKHGLGLA